MSAETGEKEVKTKKPLWKRWWVWVIALFLLVGIIGSGGNNGDDVADEAIAQEETEQAQEVVADADDTKEEAAVETDTIDVDIDADISYDDNTIYISGTTTFEDGTLLFYEVWNLDNLDNLEEGEMEVQNGEFSKEVDISWFENGTIEAWVGFSPYNQPDDIRELYGREGELIAGNYLEMDFTREFVRFIPIELSGSGDSVTDNFYLSRGPAILDISHTGGRNFIVEMKNAAGDFHELMINEIGTYSGKTLAVINQSGDYFLDITADGSWNGTISQKIPADNPSPSHTFSGTGDYVFFVDLDARMTTFEMEHDGNSNFIVLVNGMHLIANEIGRYQGSTSENVVDPGVYIISVKADGNWSISLEYR